MNIFNKFKKKSTTSSKSMLELVVDEGGRKALAFGLQWRSIVTGNTKAAGTTMARAQSATHMILQGQQVGFGVLNAKAAQGLSKDGLIYPAAQVAGRQYGGNAVFAIKVGSGEYWVALIRNGAPTSSDTFLSNSDDSAAAAAANEIKSSYSVEDKVVVYTNLDEGAFDYEVSSTSVEDLLMFASNDVDVLTLMPKAKMSIPLPILIILGIGAVGLVGSEVYKVWDKKSKAKLAFMNVAPKDDIPALWAQTIKQWESSKFGSSNSGLIMARDQIGQLPIFWSGWKLEKSKCSAAESTATSSGRNWNCSATYIRSEVGSTNAQMLASAPTGKTITFMPMNGLAMSWSFNQDFVPFEISKLETKNYHGVSTVSLFQSFASAFSQEVKLAFTPVKIQAPKLNDGTPAPDDAMVLTLSESRLLLQAPLRTIDFLIDSGVSADWDSLDISFSSSASAATLKSSSISANVSGVIYAKN